MPEATAVSGALSPEEMVEEVLETGIHHLSESSDLAFLKNIYGGLLISAGGLMALLLSTGFPQATAENPGLKFLLEGAAFTEGLVIVYFLGAELYTGYPMWLTMTALDRKGHPLQYVRAVATSLLGNLVGAFFWASVQSVFSQTVTEEPFRSGIIHRLDSHITDVQWHIIFIRSLGCGMLVTIAMMLGTQNRDGVSKAIGLYLPFFISTTAEFPHTVEYAYLAFTGMLLGARLTVWMFLWKCMLPIILGNAVGGAFVGAYNYYVFVKRADDKHESRINGSWLPADDS